MFRYEMLILSIPEITKDEASTLEFQVDKLINKVKGSMISFERWGKYRLAYPVRKNDYGVYFLIRFEAENRQSITNDLNTLFSVKFGDIVMRSLVSSLEPGQSLEYIKPPSLEDTPKRHISSFLEEKGLLKKDRPKPDPKEEQKAPEKAEETGPVKPEESTPKGEPASEEKVQEAPEVKETETEPVKEV
ncbi:30S ribosomal protein S6 [Candidatus Dependentiae bacterium]